MTSTLTNHDKQVIDFVIPALNEEWLLPECLRSIAALAPAAAFAVGAVVVVDNESADSTAAVATSLGARVVTCPPGRASRARNLGVRATTGAWVAFVDADCRLAPDWLARLAPCLADSSVVAVGGSVVAPAEGATWVSRALHAAPSLGASPAAARWLPTGGLVVRRVALEAVGGFDESLATCEDCDLGYRLGEHGRLLHVSGAVLTHLGESRTLGEVFRREAWRSSDNLRLALRRPTDLRNWASLLLPVVFAAVLVASAVGVTVALAARGDARPWLVALAVAPLLPLAAVARRGFGSPAALAQRAIVQGVHYLGRAVGLVWRAPRVGR